MNTPATGGRLEARRLLAILTAFAVGMALIFVFGGTAQADSPSSLSWDEAKNHEIWWETYGKDTHGEANWTCVKDETGSEDDAFVVPAPPTGEFWRLAVVKAGSTIVDLHWNPDEDDELEHSVQGGWSWVMLCSRPLPVTSSSAGSSSSSSDTQATTPTTVSTTTGSSIDQTTLTTAATTTSASVDQSTVTTAATTTEPSVDSTTVSTDPSTTASTDPSTTETPTSEVLGTTITTAPSSTVDDLPFTGLDMGTLLGIGVALFGLGLGLLTLIRRPQED